MIVKEGQMQRVWRTLMGRMMLFFFSSIPSICFSILYQSCNTRGYLSKTICFSVLAGVAGSDTCERHESYFGRNSHLHFRLLARPCEPDLLHRAPGRRASWSLVASYVSPVAHGPRGGLYPLLLTGRMRSLSVTSPTLAGREG